MYRDLLFVIEMYNTKSHVHFMRMRENELHVIDLILIFIIDFLI